MSIIDQYQPCVCGSGKKFKFCKCGAADHVADVEKILKLMDGNQDLAALDRINSLLNKIPNASWLLALKAELNLVMQELPQFIETANRFLKLKPDNPLALIFRSISAGMQEEPLETQARYLLEGFAESRESLTSHAFLAVNSLISRLLVSDSIGMIGIWGDLDEKTQDQNYKHSVMRDPTIHLVCKSASPIVDSPEGAPWQERLQEVQSLASSFRFEQCEKKLQSILRDYPAQPGPLSHLLRAQISQLERQSAIATAKKLSEITEVSEKDRLIFRLLSWEFERRPLEVAAKVLYGQIDSDEKVIEALAALDEARVDSFEESRLFMAGLVGDEVPAKRIFQIFTPSESENGKLYSFVGSVAVYGKQTDKPARAVLLAPDYPAYRQLIEKISGLLSITQPIEQAIEHNQSYVDFLSRNRFRDVKDKPWISIQEQSRLIVEEFLNLPLKMLDGQTPLEAASDESKRFDLVALLLHLEGSTQLVITNQSINEIYDRLNIERPAKITPSKEEPHVIKNYMDMLHFDYTNTPDQMLLDLLNLSISKGTSRLIYELACELLTREQISIDGQAVAYGTLLELDPDLRNKLDYIEKLEPLLTQLKHPMGQLVVLKTQLLRKVVSEAAANEYIMKALKKYSNDPELIAFFEYLQNVNTSRQTLNKASDMTEKFISSEPQAANQANGIILPGQSQPAGQSESKLWLPGT